MTQDSGFAPNPFFESCTLACCKPRIRIRARKGDWVAGFSGKKSGHKLIYAMEITEDPIGYAEYFNDPRFKDKKSDLNSLSLRRRVGDNIYRPVKPSGYEQLESKHTLDEMENDLRGENVLISERFFWYFGSKSSKLHKDLERIIPFDTRDYRRIENPSLISMFSHYLSKKNRGIIANPTDWPIKEKLKQDHLNCS